MLLAPSPDPLLMDGGTCLDQEVRVVLNRRAGYKGHVLREEGVASELVGRVPRLQGVHRRARGAEGLSAPPRDITVLPPRALTQWPLCNQRHLWFGGFPG